MVQLTVEKLVSKGEGLARHEGKAVFVRGALPGETVLAEVVQQTRDYDRAETVTVLESSPHRVVPACPYYDRCGGCDLQHAATDVQPAWKQEIVLENMRRIGSVDVQQNLHVLPVAFADGWTYRRRVRFHVDLEQHACGFLGRRSSDLIDIDHCPIFCDSLNRLLGEKRPLLLKAALMRKEREPWQHKNRYIEVPAFAGDTKVSLSETDVAVTIAQKTFWVDANVFFQNNRCLAPKMVDCVASQTTGTTIVDLYAGVGTFAAFVESPERRVVAVEKDKRCLSLAQKNLRYTEFLTQSAEQFSRVYTTQQVDTVIVDPPRSGLDAKVVHTIASWKPQQIIYVSCDSVTLARDCSRFERFGYRVKTLQVFDLYPQTSHIECIVTISQ